MAILASWDSGTLPTVVGSSVTSAPTGGPGGVPAIEFAQASGQVAQVRLPFTSRTNVAARAYMLMPASWAATSQSLIVGRPDGSSIIGRAMLAGSGAAGEVRLSKADPQANTSVSGSGKVAVSTWYRWELRIDQTNTRGRVGVFPLGSDAPIWDSGWATADFGAAVDRVEIGPAVPSTTLGTIRAAAIAVSDDVTGWIGRAGWDGTPPTIDVDQPAPNVIDLRGSTAGAGTLTYPTPTRTSGATVAVTSLTDGLWLFTQDASLPAVYQVGVAQTDGQYATTDMTIPPAGRSYIRIWDGTQYVAI